MKQNDFFMIRLNLFRKYTREVILVFVSLIFFIRVFNNVGYGTSMKFWQKISISEGRAFAN